MSTSDKENQHHQDAYTVVERLPRRSMPLIPMVIILAIFITLTYLFKNYFSTVSVINIATVVENKFANQQSGVVNAQAGIHELIAKGRIDEVKIRILDTDREILNAVVNGMTPIMLAASKGHMDLIDILFTQGADPNKRGAMQRTALQYACENNHIEVARKLLGYGADIDAYDTGKLTPLVMAADRGYTELGLMLIEKGANVNIQHIEGWTALIDAAARNDIKLVGALLNAGADKNLVASNGLKAIDYARKHGFKDIERILSN